MELAEQMQISVAELEKMMLDANARVILRRPSPAQSTGLCVS